MGSLGSFVIWGSAIVNTIVIQTKQASKSTNNNTQTKCIYVYRELGVVGVLLRQKNTSDTRCADGSSGRRGARASQGDDLRFLLAAQDSARRPSKSCRRLSKSVRRLSKSARRVGVFVVFRVWSSLGSLGFLGSLGSWGPLGFFGSLEPLGFLGDFGSATIINIITYRKQTDK